MRLQSNPPSHCKNGHELTEENTGWWTSKRTFSGKTRICKVCMRERMQRKRLNPNFKANEAAKMRRWRAEHPEENKQVWQSREQRVRQLLLDARACGCKLCGEKDQACLDFHHRDPLEKDGHIGQFRHFGMKRLKAEIAKCDVLCANCHRKYHRDERQGREE